MSRDNIMLIFSSKILGGGGGVGLKIGRVWQSQGNPPLYERLKALYLVTEVLPKERTSLKINIGGGFKRTKVGWGGTCWRIL